jgi:hypothetical protein
MGIISKLLLNIECVVCGILWLGYVEFSGGLFEVTIADCSV